MTKKPSYRFGEYTEPWEQKKLGEVAEVNPKSVVPDEFKYVDLGAVVGTEMISYRNETISTSPSRAQRLAIKGDVFYQTVRPYQKNNYLFKKDDNDYVFSTGYAQLRPSGDGCFLLSYLQTNKFVNVVLDNCTGTSYPAINSKDLSDIFISLPSLPEQTAIGSFFQDIDQLISLQQRKLEVLNEQKKTYLKLLFPAKGQKRPVLRFAGFEDEWKEVKLEEVCEIYDGTHQTPIYTTEGVMFLSVENIRTLNSDKYISKDAFDKNFKISPKSGDVLMTRIGDIGTSNLVETDIDLAYYVSLALIRSSVIESKFLNVSISSDYFQKELWKRTLHIAFPKKINKNEIGQSKFYYPPFPEQEAIGSFFQDLDKAIAKQEEKVNQLKESKQTLLRKMFI